MFSSNSMTLRKITTDNDVRYIQKVKQQKKLNKTQKTVIQLLENKVETFHKLTKKSLKMWQLKDSLTSNEF